MKTFEFAIVQKDCDGNFSVFFPDWSERETDLFLYANQTNGHSVAGSPRQIMSEVEKFISGKDDDELKETIGREVMRMFDGELLAPDSFIDDVAEYVRTDADELWNGDDVRMAIRNRIYDLMQKGVVR